MRAQWCRVTGGLTIELWAKRAARFLRLDAIAVSQGVSRRSCYRLPPPRTSSRTALEGRHLDTANSYTTRTGTMGVTFAAATGNAASIAMEVLTANDRTQAYFQDAGAYYRPTRAGLARNFPVGFLSEVSVWTVARKDSTKAAIYTARGGNEAEFGRILAEAMRPHAGTVAGDYSRGGPAHPGYARSGWSGSGDSHRCERCARRPRRYRPRRNRRGWNGTTAAGDFPNDVNINAPG